MITKLFDYAKKLTTKRNPLSIYKKLEQLMYGAGLHVEQIGILKNIWYITKDEKLLLKICDIHASVYNDYEAAFGVANLYLQRKDPLFYECYMTILNRKGYKELMPFFDTTDYSAKIFNLIGRYTAILFMMVYLNQEKKLQEILYMCKFLDIIEEQMKKCMSELSKEDKKVYGLVIDCQKYLSNLLSKNERNFDINSLAIKFDNKNKQAYLNIIDDYVSNDKIDLAIQFYNNNYANEFSKVRAGSYVLFFWIINEEYASLGSYYKAIQYQKYAVEYKLEGRI